MHNRKKDKLPENDRVQGEDGDAVTLVKDQALNNYFLMNA